MLLDYLRGVYLDLENKRTNSAAAQLSAALFSDEHAHGGDGNGRAAGKCIDENGIGGNGMEDDGDIRAAARALKQPQSPPPLRRHRHRRHR